MPVEVGVSIAADFGQWAVYAYDAEGVRTVVPCTDPKQPPAGS